MGEHTVILYSGGDQDTWRYSKAFIFLVQAQRFQKSIYLHLYFWFKYNLEQKY